MQKTGTPGHGVASAMESRFPGQAFSTCRGRQMLSKTRSRRAGTSGRSPEDTKPPDVRCLGVAGDWPAAADAPLAPPNAALPALRTESYSLSTSNSIQYSPVTKDVRLKLLATILPAGLPCDLVLPHSSLHWRAFSPHKSRQTCSPLTALWVQIS